MGNNCQGGESETTIGLWMKDRGVRDQMVIDSKLGFDYPGCDGGLSAAEIERECEKSLRRLQTDRIDLYYAHRDDADTQLEETMEAFDRLIKSGKVRAIGASNLATIAPFLLSHHPMLPAFVPGGCSLRGSRNGS